MFGNQTFGQFNFAAQRKVAHQPVGFVDQTLARVRMRNILRRLVKCADFVFAGARVGKLEAAVFAAHNLKFLLAGGVVLAN